MALTFIKLSWIAEIQVFSKKSLEKVGVSLPKRPQVASVYGRVRTSASNYEGIRDVGIGEVKASSNVLDINNYVVRVGLTPTAEALN